jgi:hypothetical protein
MTRHRAIAQLFAGAALLAAISSAAANPMPIPGNVLIDVPRKSIVELRFTKVVRQQFDLSCGAATVATLLSYFYDDKVDERTVIEDIGKFGDKEKIEKEGFSMLELKRFGDRRGYDVRGFKVTDTKSLAELKLPVITLINLRGYNHFVVIKGVKDGEVFYADPAFGNRSVPIEEFAQQWNSVILAFLSRTRSAKNQFVLEGGLKAPIGQVRFVLDAYLGKIRPGSGEF